MIERNDNSTVFDKILIANRGEIAVRIIRACRELSISTVAVYSTADREALHVKLADEAVCIGPAATKDSYLNILSILSACDLTGADAVHPGFGFLSENANFAKQCARLGVTFIGPSCEAIGMMGDKACAKETMKQAGVPVIPGSEGEIGDISATKALATQIGYPVLIKASAGGGGRGIRRVDHESQLEAQIIAAKQEAKNFFGNDGVYLEKFVENPRHVEVQVLADRFGNIIHLGERDCSVQRRNQKMIEEAPCPIMTEHLREQMGAAAVRAAQSCGYENAGTVEFLLDVHQKFYFMEMNTRIQVEHPVTEFVTGIDIVKEQIRIASGEPLSLKQDDLRLIGHAMECRINAENPQLNFRPSPGVISGLHLPGGPGVRIDSAVYQGYTITPYYDSMIAKLIVYASDRHTAIQKMKWALAEFLVDGVDTNIEFQLSILRDPDFIGGVFDNGFLEAKMKKGEL